jgi:hypothetical protein
VRNGGESCRYNTLWFGGMLVTFSDGHEVRLERWNVLSSGRTHLQYCEISSFSGVEGSPIVSLQLSNCGVMLEHPMHAITSLLECSLLMHLKPQVMMSRSVGHPGSGEDFCSAAWRRPPSPCTEAMLAPTRRSAMVTFMLGVDLGLAFWVCGSTPSTTRARTDRRAQLALCVSLPPRH